MAAVKGLLHAGYREKRKTKGVEHKPGIVETLQPTRKDNHEGLSQGGA